MGDHSATSPNLLTPALDSELTKALSWHNCDCECHGMPLSQAKRGMRQTLSAGSSLLRAIILQPSQALPSSTLSQLDHCPGTLDSSPQLSRLSLLSLPSWVTSLPQHLLTAVVATRQSATGTLTESLTISAAASVAGPLVENSTND